MKQPVKVRKTHPWRTNNPLSPKEEPSKAIPNYNFKMIPR